MLSGLLADDHLAHGPTESTSILKVEEQLRVGMQFRSCTVLIPHSCGGSRQSLLTPVPGASADGSILSLSRILFQGQSGKPENWVRTFPGVDHLVLPRAVLRNEVLELGVGAHACKPSGKPRRIALILKPAWLVLSETLS